MSDLPGNIYGGKLELSSTEINIIAYAFGQGKVFMLNCTNPRNLCYGTEWEEVPPPVNFMDRQFFVSFKTNACKLIEIETYFSQITKD